VEYIIETELSQREAGMFLYTTFSLQHTNQQGYNWYNCWF